MNTDSIHTIKEDLFKSILSARSNSQLDWRAFKENFSSIYPDFFTAIFIKGIQLSKKEEQLIMLEKLNINTNTIAKVLNILPESVYTSRYRLNKKLNKTIYEKLS